MVVAEDQDLALVGREGVETAPYQPLELKVFGGSLRVRSRRRWIDHGTVVGRFEGNDPANALTARAVTDQVPDDAQQPWSNGSALVESVEGIEEPDHGVLCHLGGFIAPPGEMEGEEKGLPVAVPRQPFPGLVVALDRQGDRGCIGDRHGSAHTHCYAAAGCLFQPRRVDNPKQSRISRPMKEYRCL